MSIRHKLEKMGCYCPENLQNQKDISITPTSTHDPQPTTHDPRPWPTTHDPRLQDCDNTDQLAFKYNILRFQFIILFL